LKFNFVNLQLLAVGVEIMRQVLVFPGEDGMWVAECPSLPGCIAQGDTKETAIANIREAIELYIETLVEDGIEVPDDHFDALLVAV
jgi:predicted RNase H-like HicB family nuclease